MSRLIRFVLSCLLALALPVQAHAAQTMLFCGPATAGAVHDHGTRDHRGHDDGLRAQLSHIEQAEAQPSKDVAPHHGSAFAVHEPVPLSADHEPAPASAQGLSIATDASVGSAASDLPQPKCSVCASCCSLAVLPGTWLTPVALPASFDYISASFEPHAGRVPGGLERPPRPRLA